MEEKEVKHAGPVMDQNTFEEMLDRQKQQFFEDIKNGVLHLRDYAAVRKFKSVRRAIKRGKISVFGDIYPKRPFGNTRTAMNYLKRKIYGKFKERQGRI